MKEVIKFLVVAAGLVYFGSGCGSSTTTTGTCTTEQLSTGVSITCPGQQTVFVSNGQNGSVGQTGATGAQGAQGQACTVGVGPEGGGDTDVTNIEFYCGTSTTTYEMQSTISVVQFCATAGAPSYGNFPEQGLCISGNLFGVYWDGTNSWLAQLPPGAYNSTATNLSCSFTVGTDCSVTQN